MWNRRLTYEVRGLNKQTLTRNVVYFRYTVFMYCIVGIYSSYDANILYYRYHVPRSEIDFGCETCKSNEAHKNSSIIVEKPSLSARVTQSDLFKSVDLDF